MTKPGAGRQKRVLPRYWCFPPGTGPRNVKELSNLGLRVASGTPYSRAVPVRPRNVAPALLLAASACGAGPALPPPAPVMAAAPYRIQVGDQLAVRLYLAPELNEDVTVRPDGRITTTLAQGIPAAGRTPEQVAGTLRAAYLTELKDPRLTVGVKSFAPAHVFVTGEVLAPGEFTSAGAPPSLVAAIARAGGLRPTGDPDRVLIIRRGGDDRPMVFAARYSEAVSGETPGADVPLQPYDIVVVPKTDIARVYLWVNQHIQQFVPVSWGFSYNVNPLLAKH